MNPFVTTAWLAEADDVRIVDATWFLPEHGRDARAEYRERHIPGAIFLDLAAINGDDGNLLDPRGFAEMASAHGLSDTDRIVVYDDSPLHTSARAWWALSVMGARDVVILDGGLAKWRDEGRPLEGGWAVPGRGGFLPLSRAVGAVGLAGMQAAVAQQAQVVDARGPARFRGDESEPRPGVEPGHMPGAINLHYARLYHADGTFKSPDALAAEFASAGVDLARPVIATCGSGVTAAAIVLAMARLGYDAALYDGSWAEWGSRPDTPKETGA